MLRRLFDWFSRRGGAATTDELAIIRSFLPDDDAGRRLLRQVETAMDLERTLRDRSIFRLELPFTSSELLISLDEDVTSPPLRLCDAGSGRALEFRVTARRGGFFGHLEGRAVDGGDWPHGWRLEPGALRAVDRNAIRLALPDRGDLAQEAGTRLERWLRRPGLLGEARVCVQFHQPPRAAVLESLVRGGLLVEGAAAYGELLAITDGLDLGGLHLYGTQEFYLLDPADLGPGWLVIASLDAEGVLALRRRGESRGAIHRLPAGARSAGDAEWLSPDIQHFIMDCLKG